MRDGMYGKLVYLDETKRVRTGTVRSVSIYSGKSDQEIPIQDIHDNTDDVYKISSKLHTDHKPVGEFQTVIEFQKGSIVHNGKNGLTVDELLLICSHKLSLMNPKGESIDLTTIVQDLNKAIEVLHERRKNDAFTKLEGEDNA